MNLSKFKEIRDQYEKDIKAKRASILPFAFESKLNSYKSQFEAKAFGLEFVSGGGFLLTFDYRISGGIDHGKRVSVAPWKSHEALTGMREKFAGTDEEFNSYLSYDARPCLFAASESLHVSTIMFILGMLQSDMVQGICKEVARLLDLVLDSQRVKESPNMSPF